MLRIFHTNQTKQITKMQCTEVVMSSDITSRNAVCDLDYSMYHLSLQISDAMSEVKEMMFKLDKRSDCRFHVYRLVRGFVSMAKGFLDILPYVFGLEGDLDDIICQLPKLIKMPLVHGHVNITTKCCVDIQVLLDTTSKDFDAISLRMTHELGLYHPDVKKEIVRLGLVLINGGVWLLDCLTLTRPAMARLGLLGQKMQFVMDSSEGPSLGLGDLRVCIELGGMFEKLRDGLTKWGVSDEQLAMYAVEWVRFVSKLLTALHGKSSGKIVKRMGARASAVERELLDMAWVLSSRQLRHHDSSRAQELMNRVVIDMELCLSEFGAAAARHGFNAIKTMKILAHCTTLAVRFVDLCASVLGLALTKISSDPIEGLYDNTRAVNVDWEGGVQFSSSSEDDGERLLRWVDGMSLK